MKGVASILPEGLILPWHGSGSPDKPWVVCDGNNGTPNLTGTFLMGANSEHPPGSFGGSPKHYHKVFKDGGRDGRGFEVDGTCGLGDTDVQENLPPFFAVRYIMFKPN